MVPVFRIGGTSVLFVFLAVLVTYGSLHLLATAYPDSKFAHVWVGALGF